MSKLTGHISLKCGLSAAAVGSTRTGSAKYRWDGKHALGPMTAVGLGAVVLGEEVTWLTVVGLAAVVLGLASAWSGEPVGLAPHGCSR
jgi:drug/metabolite transporter (DMT)-like permease